jgi:hypothetical protein
VKSPVPDFPIEELVGATAEEVVRRLGGPDGVEVGEIWWSPEHREAVSVESGELVVETVYGPVPTRIAPGTPYEVWYYGFGQTFEEAARAFLEPGPAAPEGETWHLYLVTRGTTKSVVEVAAFPAGIDF